MKYITVDREHEDMKWSKIYCNLNGKETPEDQKSNENSISKRSLKNEN